jgi:hypothetical protein
MSALPPRAWPFPTGNKPQPASAVNGGANYAAGSTRKAWSPADLKAFAKLIVANETPADMAKKLGRTVKAIVGQLGDLKTGKTATALTLASYVKHETKVSVKPKHHDDRWDNDGDRTLLLAYATGGTPEQIGAACGRTAYSVAGRLHALGVLKFDKDNKTYMTVPQAWFKVAD